MISILKGTIEDIGKDSLVVMTSGGVGYEARYKIHGSRYNIGDSVVLQTYLKVSEHAMELYAFETKDEREFFELLLTVSGVGPKAAMRVLSLGSLVEIQAAIARGDAKYLTAVQGMGAKTAERLVVELKSKIKDQRSKIKDPGKSEVLAEVIDGLVSMGYGKDDARIVVESLESKDKSTEELLRLALRYMK